ncbi:hypothetical protein [Pseudomonas veronii]|jgi:hypothetical protein
MTQHNEQYSLAESLARAIEQAEHKPGQWSTTAQSMGGICNPVEKFQIGRPWPKEEPWASFSYKRDSWLAVAAVNALPELMALLGPHDELAEDLIKGLVDLAQVLGSDERINILLLAAASRIRRQEAKLELLRTAQ